MNKLGFLFFLALYVWAGDVYAQIPRTVYSVDQENKLFEKSLPKYTPQYNKTQEAPEPAVNVYKNYNKIGYVNSSAGVVFSSGKKFLNYGENFGLKYRQGYDAKIAGGYFINQYVSLGMDMGFAKTSNNLTLKGEKVGRREENHFSFIPTITLFPLPKSAIQPFFRFGVGVDSVSTSLKYNKASTLLTTSSCTANQQFNDVDNILPANINATSITNANGDTITTLSSTQKSLLLAANTNGALCTPQLDENQAPITDANGNTTPLITDITTGKAASSPQLKKANYNLATKIEMGVDVNTDNWGFNIKMERVWHDILETRENASNVFSLGGKINF